MSWFLKKLNLAECCHCHQLFPTKDLRRIATVDTYNKPGVVTTLCFDCLHLHCAWLAERVTAVVEYLAPKPGLKLFWPLWWAAIVIAIWGYFHCGDDE
jgi:hypothetical protein